MAPNRYASNGTGLSGSLDEGGASVAAVHAVVCTTAPSHETQASAGRSGCAIFGIRARVRRPGVPSGQAGHRHGRAARGIASGIHRPPYGVWHAPSTALRIADEREKIAKPYDLLFYEEPLRYDDPEGHAELRRFRRACRSRAASA
jgi:hypothetical protein